MLTAWVSHGVYMVHTWSMEIKKYDIKAHVYGILALKKKYSK